MTLFRKFCNCLELYFLPKKKTDLVKIFNNFALGVFFVCMHKYLRDDRDPLDMNLKPLACCYRTFLPVCFR